MGKHWVSSSLSLPLILKLTTDVYYHILVKNSPPFSTYHVWNVLKKICRDFYKVKMWITWIFSILPQVQLPFPTFFTFYGKSFSLIFLVKWSPKRHGKALERIQSDDFEQLFPLILHFAAQWASRFSTKTMTNFQLAVFGWVFL